MLVRQLNLNDLEALMRLYTHLDKKNADFQLNDRTTGVWQELCSSPDHLYFGVEEDGGQLAASCTATIIPNLTNGARPYSLIENVVTQSSFRRRGYRRSVMQAAIDLSRGGGCYKIMLMSGYQRGAGAHQFYRSLGFEQSK